MFSGISPIQLLIVLVIVLAIFGTKKFRSMGSDLGGAVKGFRSAMSDAEKDPAEKIGDQSEDADFDNTPVDEPSNSTSNRKNSEN